MGKRAKAHRQKVAKRNEKINQSQKIYEKMYNEMLKQHVEAIRKEKLSGDTPTEITE
jgi:hypothetical protein